MLIYKGVSLKDWINRIILTVANFNPGSQQRVFDQMGKKKKKYA
jgi:hypothetical protein